MTDETNPNKVETLAELKRRVSELEAEMAGKDKEIDKLKQREEGWLVITNNPQYNDTTMGVLFTDGIAFIQKDRQFEWGDARLTVKLLESDFGYKTVYFTKDQADELEKIKQNRAMERKIAQEKLGTREDMIEKLMASHHM